MGPKKFTPMIAAHKALRPLTSSGGRAARSTHAVAASEICTDAATKSALCCRWLRSLHRTAVRSCPSPSPLSRLFALARSVRVRAISVHADRLQRRRAKVPRSTTYLRIHRNYFARTYWCVEKDPMIGEECTGGVRPPSQVPAEQRASRITRETFCPCYRNRGVAHVLHWRSQVHRRNPPSPHRTPHRAQTGPR